MTSESFRMKTLALLLMTLALLQMTLEDFQGRSLSLSALSRADVNKLNKRCPCLQPPAVPASITVFSLQLADSRFRTTVK